MSKTDFTKMNEFQYSLLNTGLINWYAALIPISVLLFLSIKKVPAFLALTAGSITAIIISLFTNPQGFGSILSTLFGGYVSETGNARSEERRVGKECRSRWWGSQETIKKRWEMVDRWQ